MRLWACCRKAEIFAFLLASPFALLPAPALAGCPAAGAVYHMATDAEGARAVLRIERDANLMTGMVLVLALPGLDPVRFEMIQAQGYGSTSAWPLPGTVFSEEATEGLPLAMFDTAGDRLVPYADILPFADSSAPAAIYVTGLGPTLWYGATLREERIALPQEMWYRAACGG